MHLGKIKSKLAVGLTLCLTLGMAGNALPAYAADTGSDEGRTIEFPFISVAWSDFVKAMQKVPEADAVTLADKEAIWDARTAYNKLTRDEDKESAAVNLLPKLQAAEKALDLLEGNTTNADTSGYTHYTENTSVLKKGEDFNLAIKKLVLDDEKATKYKSIPAKHVRFFSGDKRLAEALEEGQPYTDVSAKNDDSIRAFWNEKTETISVVGVNGKNIKAATDASYMFYMFDNVLDMDLKDLDTSSTVKMYSMFANMRSITSIELSSVDTSNVTDMSNMFYYDKALTALDLRSFDTRKVTTMAYMFYDCTGLESIDVSAFNTKKVTSMMQMFMNCEALKSLDLSSFNTNNVTTSMFRMFYGDENLEELNISSFRTPKVTSFSGMFANCKNLAVIDVSKFETGNATSMFQMFYYCQKVEKLDVGNFDTGNVRDNKPKYGSATYGMKEMFLRCESLKSIDISSWDTSKIWSYNGMFYGCNSLTDAKIGKKAAAEGPSGYPADTGRMFGACSSLESLDLSGFDVSNVTTMSSMFAGCTALKNLNLSGWTVPQSPYMGSMFQNCTSLEELDLHDFAPNGSVLAMNTFSNCSSLKTIYVTEEKMGKEQVYSYQDSTIFNGCVSIVGGAGTTYQAKVADKQQNSQFAHVDGGASNPGYFTAYDMQGYTVTPTAEATEIYATEDTTISAATALNYNGKSKAFDETYTYTSENTDIATVDKDGVVTGVDEGTAKIIVLGASSGEDYKAEIEIKVNRIAIDDATVSEVENQTWTGEEIKPEATVTLNDTELVKDTDFEVTYADNVDVGTAAFAITGTGKYKGTVNKEFQIVKPEGSAVITAAKKQYVVAAGEALTLPAADNGTEGEEVSSWSATLGKYTKYFAAGDAITADDINDLSDKKGNIALKAYYAEDAISLETKGGNAKAEDAIWTGEALTPNVVVKHGKAVLNDGEDYVVSFENNTDVGTGTATVKGVGLYKGTLTASFAITADKTELNKVISDAKTISNADETYTTDSYKALTDAIAEAEKVAEDDTATDETVKAAAKAISDAREKLTENPVAEKEAVEKVAEAVEDAKTLSENDYTAESYAALKDAIAEAEKVLADEDARTTEVAAALTRVNEAKENLKAVSAAEEKAELTGTLDEAEAISNADGTYSAESYQALLDAIDRAYAVAVDPNAKKSDVAAAQKAVEDAKAALKKSSSTNNTEKPADDTAKATDNTTKTTGSTKAADSTTAAGKNTTNNKKVVKGKTYKVSKQSYKVTKVSKGKAAGTVTFTKAKNAKSVAVPKTVKLADGKNYKVTVIAGKAFTAKKIRTVTIGANVKKINKNAFAKSKAATAVIKTKLLKKASVKGSLKGSKIKTVQVKIGSKKVNKTYLKKYKKLFTKAVAGKKVTVK